jgi:hypothetical protein
MYINIHIYMHPMCINILNVDIFYMICGIYMLCVCVCVCVCVFSYPLVL